MAHNLDLGGSSIRPTAIEFNQENVKGRVFRE
jgi:hypothetical protein